MINAVVSLYSPSYAATVIYMLQSTEYHAKPYLRWYWRTGDFRQVMYRRRLDKTRAATLLLALLMFGMIIQIIAGLTCIWLWNTHGLLVRSHRKGTQEVSLSTCGGWRSVCLQVSSSKNAGTFWRTCYIPQRAADYRQCRYGCCVCGTAYTRRHCARFLCDT